MSDIKKRIEMLVNTFSGGNNSEFARKLNTNETSIRNYITGKSTPKYDTLAQIADVFGINCEWLLLGKGDIKEKKEKTPVLELVNNSKRIPLVSAEAVAGFGDNNFSITKDDIINNYIIPDFTEIDFLMRVKGDSMYPKYTGGDIVACKKIRPNSYIQWGKVHVIATSEQGILIKKVYEGQSQDYIKAISENEMYKPFEIPKEEITGLALVVGVVRME